MLRGLLEANGTPAVCNEVTGSILETDNGSVWVNREDVDAAKTVVTQQRELASLGDGWVCPSCNELIELQFDVCWSCGHSCPGISEDPQGGR